MIASASAQRIQRAASELDVICGILEDGELETSIYVLEKGSVTSYQGYKSKLHYLGFRAFFKENGTYEFLGSRS